METSKERLVGFKVYIPLPAEEQGGSDWSMVELDFWGKPSCKEHGAMNKVSESPPNGGGFWRCLQGPEKNRCRAGCREE